MKCKIQNIFLPIRQTKIKNFIFICGLWFLVFNLIGCEAFVRKFTRKPKEKPKEEMVIAPEEYKGPKMTKEQLYRQYFLFWKSWQDELINALDSSKNHKKRIDCAAEAIENLELLKALLKADKQKVLDAYLNQLRHLKDLISKDLYGYNVSMHRLIAERIKRNILRDFSYPKIKDFLV